MIASNSWALCFFVHVSKEKQNVLAPAFLIHLQSDCCLVSSDFCDPLNCSQPGFSIHGIILARILEWVAVSSSKGSSQPRDGICVSCDSCIGRQILYHRATRETPRLVFFHLGDIAAMSGDVGCHGWGDATGITWLEARAAAPYPAQPRTPLQLWSTHISVVLGLRSPPDMEEPGSFPKIKCELCEKANRISPQGTVESLCDRSRFPLSSGQMDASEHSPSRGLLNEARGSHFLETG